MRHNTKFTSLMKNNEWFGTSDRNICYLQDIIHSVLKLRNRLLNPSAVLLIGEKIASVSHLKYLLNTVSKDAHGLVYSDICPDDRQNYESLRKAMQPKVREALAAFVIDSEATIEYIRICEEISSSLYEDNLPPLMRLFRIWRATFFLRAWRLFIHLNSKDPDFKDSDFITQNAYVCIEINAQNLTILMRKFRAEGIGECFLPTLFNSQPCEETFRKMRSMGTINYTKINFTLLELIHLIGRVELMNEIMYFKLSNVDVKFPRNRTNKSSPNQFNLPSDNEIDNCIQSALDVAIADALRFGIHVTKEEITECQLGDRTVDLKQPNNEHIDLKIGAAEESNLIDCQSLKDYSSEGRIVDESSPYVSVTCRNGQKTVRKSSLMWILSETKDKLSSDRLKRVQGGEFRKSCRRKLEFIDVTKKDRSISKMEEIQINDWCIFNNHMINSQSNKNGLMLGSILSFKYINGKTNKEKQYTLDFAPIFHENENTSRGLEVLARWYNVNSNGAISTFKSNSCLYVNIDFYFATLSKQTIYTDQNKQIHFTEKCLCDIKKVIETRQFE